MSPSHRRKHIASEQWQPTGGAAAKDRGWHLGRQQGVMAACLYQKLHPLDSPAVFSHHSTPRDPEAVASHGGCVPEKPQMNLTLTTLPTLWRKQGYARFRGPWVQAFCLCPWTLSSPDMFLVRVNLSGRSWALPKAKKDAQRGSLSRAQLHEKQSNYFPIY